MCVTLLWVQVNTRSTQEPLRGGGLSEQVEGRLGRPLSEASEFWRAAPEEALLWGSDEFGYPHSPRGGPLDFGAEEGDLSRAAAGHMRAAGLRL